MVLTLQGLLVLCTKRDRIYQTPTSIAKHLEYHTICHPYNISINV